MGLDTAIYFLAFLIPGALGFGIFSFYTHILPPVEYGIYSTSVSVAFFVGSFLFSWIRFSLARHESESSNAPLFRFWMTCFFVTFVTGLMLTSMTIYFYVDKMDLIIPVFVLSASQALFELTQEIRRSKNNSKAFARFNIARSVLTSGLGAVVALRHPQGNYLVLSMAFGFLAVAAIGSRRHFALLAFQNNPPALKEVFVYGAGIAVSGLVFSSIGVVSRLVVAFTLGAAAAGQYNASFDLAGQVGSVVALSVFSSVGPKVIRAYASAGTESARAEFAKGIELLCFAIVPTLLGLALVARPLATVITGAAYHDSIATLLPLSVLAVGLAGINNYYLHLAFQIMRKPMRQVTAGVIQAIAVPILVYAGVRLYGIEGAAIGVVAADLVGMFATVVLVRATFPIPFPAGRLSRIAGCSVLMAVVVIVVMHQFKSPIAQLAFGAFSGALTYALSAYGLDVLGLRSRVLTGVALKRIFQRIGFGR